MPYLENIRYKSLLVREKGKLDTYTVLLLGANPPLISSGGAGPGDPKSASLSWGSSPTVRCPSQLPWHHGSREGSGSVDEKVAAVAPLPGSPLTHALEAGLGAGAFADVFMRAGSAAWERGDERTIVFTGSPGGSESWLTEEMKCGLKDDMTMKDSQEKEYLLEITPVMATIE